MTENDMHTTVRSHETLNPQRSIFARLCGLLVVLTLCEYVFGWDIDIDQWLFRNPVGTVDKYDD